MHRFLVLLLAGGLWLLVPAPVQAQQPSSGAVVVDTSDVTVPVRVRVSTVDTAARTAAPEQQPSEPTRPALRGSRKALSFTFDQFSLNALTAGVGGKYWFNSSVALRGAFRFNVEAIEDDIDTDETSGRSAIGFGFSLVAERHNPDLVNVQRVSPYLAGGMRFDVSGFSESTQYPLGNDLQEVEFDGSQLSFSVLAGLGVEYRFSRRVSLAGEHVFAATIERISRDRREQFRDLPDVEQSVDQRAFRLGTGTSSLILSVYF